MQLRTARDLPKVNFARHSSLKIKLGFKNKIALEMHHESHLVLPYSFTVHFVSC